MICEINHSFKNIRKDWARLYADMVNPSPFLHPSAFAIAHKYFYPYYLAHLMRPCFAVLREQDRVVGIVPMVKYLGGKYQLFGNSNGYNWGG